MLNSHELSSLIFTFAKKFLRDTELKISNLAFGSSPVLLEYDL